MLQKAKPWSLFCKTMNKRWLTKVLHWLFNVKYAVLLIHYIILNTWNDSLDDVNVVLYSSSIPSIIFADIKSTSPAVILHWYHLIQHGPYKFKWTFMHTCSIAFGHKNKNMNNILYMALTLSLKIRNVISLSSDRFCSHVTSLVIDLIYRTTGFEI